LKDISETKQKFIMGAKNATKRAHQANLTTTTVSRLPMQINVSNQLLLSAL